MKANLEGRKGLGADVEQVRGEAAAHPGSIALDGGTPTGPLNGFAATGFQQHLLVPGIRVQA